MWQLLNYILAGSGGLAPGSGDVSDQMKPPALIQQVEDNGPHAGPFSRPPERDTRVFKKVAVGKDHSCALTIDGQLFCVGNDDYGKVSGPNETRGRPGNQYLLRLPHFSDVAVGDDHTCAINDLTGKVACWGRPSDIDDIPNATFKSLDGGGRHTCGIIDHALIGQPFPRPFLREYDEARLVNRDGTVACWGANDEFGAQVPFRIKALAVSTSKDETCVLVDGNATGDNHVGSKIRCFGSSSKLSRNYYSDVSVLNEFLCTIRADRDSNISCFSGSGNRPSNAEPEGSYQKVDVGGDFSCALSTTNGRLTCWKADQMTFAPRGRFKEFSVGHSYACGIRDRRARPGLSGLVCWTADGILPQQADQQDPDTFFRLEVTDVDDTDD